MPFARIDVPADFSEERIAKISDVVLAAMEATLGVPPGDRFHLFTSSERNVRQYDRSYLGISRSQAVVFIDVTLRRGRDVEKKKAFYAQVAGELHSQCGIAKADVFIVLTENDPTDWSFGNGEAQYA